MRIFVKLNKTLFHGTVSLKILTIIKILSRHLVIIHLQKIGFVFFIPFSHSSFLPFHDLYFSLVKAMVFPVVMYGCESWTVKKAERRRIELWCWRRLLRVPWAARRSNQSLLKEISPEYSLVGVMLKLKLQYFGHRI